MTVLVGVEPYLLQTLQDFNTGQSPSAHLIPDRLIRIRLGLTASCTGNERTSAFLDLLDTYDSRSVPTAEDSVIFPDALFEAARFLEGLPPDVPAPEVDATPAGEIAFSWQVSGDHSYLITFLGDATVAYAGLFGAKSRTRGREAFIRQIPPGMLLDLRRLHSSAG